VEYPTTRLRSAESTYVYERISLSLSGLHYFIPFHCSHSHCHCRALIGSETTDASGRAKIANFEIDQLNYWRSGDRRGLL